MSRPRSRVVLLTRHPRLGEVMTRLAASIGDDAALEVHDRLARRTLSRLLALQATGEATVEVRTDAAFQQASREWLTPRAPRRSRPHYRYQGDGDLGAKLRLAFADGFGRKDERVVIVGSDCARLESRHLRAALASLDTADVVLGPATDGGYWLIGIARRAAERALGPLFGDIPWGSADVFSQTRNAAEKSGLAVAVLGELPDVDTAEDLDDALAALDADAIGGDSVVSVIIPALDEAATVSAAVRSALDGGAAEVIVADGGSADDTRDVAQRAGARVIGALPGRAIQMNAGAAVATGDVLCFLHSDTLLPPAFADLARSALARPRTVACAFDFAVPANARHAATITTLGQARWRLTGLPYGDQCPCMPRWVFHSLGGFPELPVMEDWEMARRLRALGCVERVPRPAVTSARAWERGGLIAPTLANLAVIAGYRLGFDPERLARWRR